MTASAKPDHFIKTTALLLLMIFGGFMVSDMYLPAMPHLIGAFHTTAKYVQLTITVYFIGACIAMLCLGPISDRIGRRKVILFGMLMMIIGTACCFLAHDYTPFLVGRIFQGLGAGAGFAVMRTVMRDMVKGDDLAHVLAYIAIIVGVCPAAAPALGGIIVTHLGWRTIFEITLIYYILLFIAMALLFTETLVKETQIKNRGENVFSHAFEALKHKEFMCYCLISAATYAGLMAYVTASPMIIEVHLHYTPLEFGYITLSIVVLGQLSKIFNRIYLKRFGYKKMMKISMSMILLGSFSLLAFGLFHIMALYAVMIPMVIYSNGLGMLFPNLSTAALTVFTTIIGMASALYGTVQMAGGLVGSGIIAHFSESTLIPIGAIMSVLSIIAVLALTNALRLGKQQTPAAS
jgi:Bcr/CflA subfamily drug resistance transporter